MQHFHTRMIAMVVLSCLGLAFFSTVESSARTISITGSAHSFLSSLDISSAESVSSPSLAAMTMSQDVSETGAEGSSIFKISRPLSTARSALRSGWDAMLPAHAIGNGNEEFVGPVLIALDDAERVGVLLLVAGAENLTSGKIAVECERSLERQFRFVG